MIALRRTQRFTSHVVTSRNSCIRVRQDGEGGFCQTLPAAAYTYRPLVEEQLPWMGFHAPCSIEYLLTVHALSGAGFAMLRCIKLRDRFAPPFPARLPIRPSRQSFVLFRKTLGWKLPFDVRNSPQPASHPIPVLGSYVRLRMCCQIGLYTSPLPACWSWRAALRCSRRRGCSACARAPGLGDDEMI